MNEKDLMPLPDVRQAIHDLTLMKQSTGLSPPEEELLLLMEAQENCAPSEKY